MIYRNNVDIPIESNSTNETLGIHGVKFDFGVDQGLSVLLTGGIHGDEPTSVGALWYLIEKINDGSLPIRKLTIIPTVNILALQASSRTVPIEGSDLNRSFPGRSDGSLSERIAFKLVELLESHDALIDVHTAGWCTPFVLIDEIANVELKNKIINWAVYSSLPVVGEMLKEHALLQGLDRSWSAWATSKGKLAFTLELTGFHTFDSTSAQHGADILFNLLKELPTVTSSLTEQSKYLYRSEIYSNISGLFEAYIQPGNNIVKDTTIGVIRLMDGTIVETLKAKTGGQILALQPISAIHIGSWLATLAISAIE